MVLSMNTIVKALSVSAALVGATQASAAVFTFDFSELDGTGSSYTTTVDGLTLTVTAGSFIDGFDFPSSTTRYDSDGNAVRGYVVGNSNSFDDSAYLTADSPDGLGVMNNVSYSRRNGRTSTDDSYTTDGSYWDDFLIFSFSADVQLDHAVFGDYDSNDDYRLMYDLNGNGSLGYGDYVTFSRDGNPTSSFPSVMDNVFGFLATGSNDNWRIRSLSVSGDLSTVPVPAGGLLLMTGLAGFAAMRRRKSKA